jgi:hypothetical protein
MGSLGMLSADSPPARHDRGPARRRRPGADRHPDWSKWTNTWPVPVKAADVPLGFDGIPEVVGQAGRDHHPGTRGRSTAARAKSPSERPTWGNSSHTAQQGVGLKTVADGAPPLPPPTVQPYPKLGLASTSPLAFKRIEPIDQGDPIWMRGGGGSARHQQGRRRHGRAAAHELGPQLKHPTPAPIAPRCRLGSRRCIACPRKRPVRSTTSRRRSATDMPPLPADRRARHRSPTGRLLGDDVRQRLLRRRRRRRHPAAVLDVRVTSCDYDTVSLMLPLGAIGEGGTQVLSAR